MVCYYLLCLIFRILFWFFDFNDVLYPTDLPQPDQGFPTPSPQPTSVYVPEYTNNHNQPQTTMQTKDDYAVWIHLFYPQNVYLVLIVSHRTSDGINDR